MCLGSSTDAARPSRLLDGTSEFVLTYEDKDGDCMLVGDVPWQYGFSTSFSLTFEADIDSFLQIRHLLDFRMFLSSVKRLRIMKNSESNEPGEQLCKIEVDYNIRLMLNQHTNLMQLYLSIELSRQQ